ncbi:hypothetical protein SNK03_000898 [Fusarium graminearum]
MPKHFKRPAWSTRYTTLDFRPEQGARIPDVKLAQSFTFPSRDQSKRPTSARSSTRYNCIYPNYTSSILPSISVFKLAQNETLPLQAPPTPPYLLLCRENFFFSSSTLQHNQIC